MMSMITQRFRSCFQLYLQKRLVQTLPKIAVPGEVVPIFGNVQNFPEKVALKDDVNSYTYANIFLSAKSLAAEITQKVGGRTNERVLFLCPNDANYVVTLWAIWMSGQIAVPLSSLQPKNILLYYANDTSASLLVTTPGYAELMHKVAVSTNAKLHVLDDKLKLNATEQNAQSKSDLEGGLGSNFYYATNALILYTSGTTGNPKGVVLTHRNLINQVNTLVDAWKWCQNDVILHTLPLHHVHGIVNALLCPLYIGAKTVMLPKFNANAVWSHLLAVNAKPNDRKITVYMAVPTIYAKLIEEYQTVFSSDTKMSDYIRNTLKNKVRLMVSGSATLSPLIFDKWLAISGHRLLERYGMTEIGMCLSNSHDPDSREPGYVGLPLPGVSVQIVDNGQVLLKCSNTNGNVTFSETDSAPPPIGELFVKGGGVFKTYYNRPDTTRTAFTTDGWFKTGDICQYSKDKNKFKMMGRQSADIIKSGGFKISALEIEACLMEHPHVKDCAVLGLDDAEWGEKVAALVVGHDNVIIMELEEWVGARMAKYCVPKVIKVVDVIPKNVMGKVNKKELAKTIFNEE